MCLESRTDFGLDLRLYPTICYFFRLLLLLLLFLGQYSLLDPIAEPVILWLFWALGRRHDLGWFGYTDAQYGCCFYFLRESRTRHDAFFLRSTTR